MNLTQLRRMIVGIVVGVAFFANSFFGNSSPAIAHPLTPEADSYQVSQTAVSADSSHDWYPDQRPLRSYMKNADVNPTDSPTDNDVIDGARRNIQGMADTVREKLNLDQPLYPGTKEFANDVKNRAGDVVEESQRTLEDVSSSVRNALD